MKKCVSVLLVAVCLTACLFAAAAEGGFEGAPKIKIRFAENQPSSSPLGTVAVAFAEELKEKTGGTLEMDLYFDALMGDESTVCGMVEAGAVEFTRINLGAFTATVPETGVLTLPYIYRDAVHCHKVMTSDVARELLELVDTKGFKGLAFLGGSPENPISGARCFYSSKDMDTLDKLKGKKIRVQESEVVISMIEALGGVATPMAYGEVFQALQTGIVDAAENDIMSYVLSGHYEVAKRYTMDCHQISPSVYLMSRKCWDSMTAEQQEAFKSCLDSYIARVQAENDALYATYRQQAEAAGCVFVEMDNAPYKEACKAVYEKYPEFAENIKRIQDMQ